MVWRGAVRVAAVLTVALTAVPGSAQQALGITDFLTAIGGNTDIKTSGSLRTDPEPQIYPLIRDRDEIAGYRFFSEKLIANGSATAERARDAFARECDAKGGKLEPDESDVARAFRDRVLGRRLPPRGGFKHFWSGISAVCSRGSAQVLGGFVAITYDTTEVGTKGDFGSRLLSRVSTIPTRTAVYAYRRNLIRSAASLSAQNATMLANHDAEQRARGAFRRGLAVGTETNCGTVIQVRGPMVEVAVPPTTLTPNGQSSFWSRRDALAQPLAAPCTFGL